MMKPPIIICHVSKFYLLNLHHFRMRLTYIINIAVSVGEIISLHAILEY